MNGDEEARQMCLFNQWGFLNIKVSGQRINTPVHDPQNRMMVSAVKLPDNCDVPGSNPGPSGVCMFIRTGYASNPPRP